MSVGDQKHGMRRARLLGSASSKASPRYIVSLTQNISSWSYIQATNPSKAIGTVVGDEDGEETFVIVGVAPWGTGEDATKPASAITEIIRVEKFITEDLMKTIKVTWNRIRMSYKLREFRKEDLYGRKRSCRWFQMAVMSLFLYRILRLLKRSIVKELSSEKRWPKRRQSIACIMDHDPIQCGGA